ncbi:MAG: HAMP domain-containing sensor histidine kinase [Firmicutes bacterium]|nr:HAMP domain-containing sensor histidine kinase [Bacillota bacterium]
MKKFLASLIIGVALILTSTSLYIKVKDNANIAITDVKNDDQYVWYMIGIDLREYNYVLNNRITGLTAEDYFGVVQENNVEAVMTTNQTENAYEGSYSPQSGSLLDVIDTFKNMLADYDLQLDRQKDFDYTIYDHVTNETYYNNIDLYHDYDSEEYPWYIKVVYDEKGNAKYSDQNGNDFNYILGDYMEYFSDIDVDDQKVSDVMDPISNKTIIYGLKKDNNGFGRYNYLTSLTYEKTLMYSIVPCALGVILMMLLVLFIPYQYEKESTKLNFVANIKFGILAFVITWIVLLFGMLGVWCLVQIPYTSIENFAKEFRMTVDNIELLRDVCLFVSIVVELLMVIIVTYVFKVMFKKGIGTYFKENTILGYIVSKSSVLYHKIVTFDFSDPVLLIVLKGSLIIMAICISTSLLLGVSLAYGFIVTLIISIVNYLFISKVKKDHDELLDITSKIADGDFDVKANDNMIYFKEVCNNVTSIKASFEKSVKEEVKSQNMKTELISNVSHDLKTPLTNIITYTDLLKNENLSKEDIKGYVESLERAGNRLKTLIDDLFEVSKANSGDIKLDIQNVDIIAIIKEAILESSELLNAKKLTIKENYSDNSIIMPLDGNKTYRIFENCLSNISKYALEYTRVYVDVTQDDKQVKIVFKNVSNQEMDFDSEHIMERFVQGDKSRNTVGSGLGLAIAKSFANIQNGDFKIETDGDLFKAIIIFKKTTA